MRVVRLETSLCSALLWTYDLIVTVLPPLVVLFFADLILLPDTSSTSSSSSVSTRILLRSFLMDSLGVSKEM